MERTISQIFLDKCENIYLVDNKNILYLYDDGMYYPFMEIFKNIKKCFQIRDKFYIYYGNLLGIFDDANLLEITSQND